MNTQEALKMAIEWVEGWKGIAPSKIELLRVLREALAQPAQEPVAYCKHGVPKGVCTLGEKDCNPAPSWQGLSDDEKKKIWFNLEHEIGEDIVFGGKLADAIEQALKEKNA